MKRTSLFAVAALDFGVLSVALSIVAACVSVVTTLTTVAYGNGKTLPTVGATVSLNVLLVITEDGAKDETSKIVAFVTTKPNKSLVAAGSVTASVTGL